MSLAPSSRLGPYEILSPIGAGGMGEVYKARDTRLNRVVAIKVLSGHLAERSDLRQRFEREAKAISSLSHKNICALFDIGVHEGQDYLVMEYLDGESLAERLAHGPLKMEETFRYGIEIAEALEVAHRHGVVHRDLKPGNVVLTKGGAKLLDFGLAKTQTMSVPSESSDLPTEAAPITKEGTILGTLQYMAPEQVEAKESDARTDIFALGAILYEMATGRRAFAATSQATLVAAILKDPVPPPSETQPLSSPEFDRIVRRCLEKDPDSRWQSASDLADELRWVQGGTGSRSRTLSESLPGDRPRSRPLVLGFLLAAALLGTTTLGWLAARRQTPIPSSPESRFSIEVPTRGSSVSQLATYSELAVSPDGKMIAYVAISEAESAIWIRQINSIQPRKLEGTSGGKSPFWSPDGRMVGFFAEGKLKKISVEGGAVDTICEGNGGSADWGTDGQIIFGVWGPDDPKDQNATNALRVVSASGGPPRRVTSGPGWHFWPQFLSDGKHFLYFRNYGMLDKRSGLYVQTSDEKTPQFITHTFSKGLVSRDHHLFFVRDGILVSQKLNESRWVTEGEPVPIAEPVFYFAETGAADFSISTDHRVIAYLRAAAVSQLTWCDRNGRKLETLGDARIISSFRISPDQNRVVEQIVDTRSGTPNLWTIDLARATLSRLTDEAYGAFAPVWTQNGDQVIASLVIDEPTSPPQITVLSLDGRTHKALSHSDGPQYATDATANDVIYSVNRSGNSDIEQVSIKDGSPAIPLKHSHFNETQGTVSNGGRWLAFTSSESGRPEVYMQSMKPPGEKIQISSEGGTEPSWRRDNKELFFVGPDQNLISVAIESIPAFKIGRPMNLFRINSVGMLEFSEFNSVHYVASPDGQKFLIRSLPGEYDAPPIAVILNWGSSQRKPGQSP